MEDVVVKIIAVVIAISLYVLLGMIIYLPIKIYKRKKAIKRDEFNKNLKTDENGNIMCPYCGCSQIQIVKQKFNLLEGFSTNRNERVCTRCMRQF